MSRFSCLSVLCVSVVFGSAGCQAVTNYPRDRLLDLVDVVGFDVYWGQGILANIRATKVIQAGIGSFDGDVITHSRRQIGGVEEMRSEFGVPFYYFTAYDRKVAWGNENIKKATAAIPDLGRGKYNLSDPDDRGFYEFGADVSAFFGLGFNIDLYQAMDFALGWFMLDIGRDDVRNADDKAVQGPRFEPIVDTPVSEGMEL